MTDFATKQGLEVLLRSKIEIWNVFDRSVTFRTTNFCGNWNMLWKQKLGTKNPNVWKVIQNIQENEKNSRMNILRHAQGETPAPQKKLYREYNDRITRIKNSYLSGSLSVQQYWLSMAELFRKLNNFPIANLHFPLFLIQFLNFVCIILFYFMFWFLVVF